MAAGAASFLPFSSAPMTFLAWAVAAPLLIGAAVFAVVNRSAVTVSLWPVAEPVTLPLFVIVVAALYVGFIIGAVVAWWAGRRGRARARQRLERIRDLQQELDRLQRLAQSAGDQPPAAALPPPRLARSG